MSVISLLFSLILTIYVIIAESLAYLRTLHLPAVVSLVLLKEQTPCGPSISPASFPQQPQFSQRHSFICSPFGTHSLSHSCQAQQEANKTESLSPRSSSPMEGTKGKLILKLHIRLHLKINICRPRQRVQIEALIPCI